MKTSRNSFPTFCFLVILLLSAAAELRAQEWQARHNMTQAQLQTTFNELTKQGYRMKSVNGYTSGGAELYTGLWVKEPGSEWYARSGLNQADFQKVFDDYVKQGFRLTWISGYEVSGVVKYAGIFEKIAGPAWEALSNLSAAEFQQKFDTFTKQGYRLTHLCGYASAGAARFAGIFEKMGGPEWQARNNLTAEQYQQTFNDFSKQGYRLKDVSGYNVGGQDYYAAIWEKQNGPVWYSRNGVPDAWYQNVFDNFYYQGYHPTLVTAFASGGAAKMNGIWENPNFKPSDLQIISSQMQQYMSMNQIPGAALAITKDGRLVYAAGFGYANKETGEEAGPTNLWRIASVSKPFTSVTIMKLIEKGGTLNLSDHVFGPGGILTSEFPTPPGNTKINEITIQYLLEHVSGLSNAGGDPMFMNTGMNHQQLISWMLNDSAHRMTRDTNTQFEYLNFGFCLLGRVIEKKTGKGYEEYVKEAVLKPIGITDMAIGGNSEAARKPREVKYYPADAYTLNVTRFDSHGGWVASPVDLVRFLVRVDGQPTKPDIISAKSHIEMTTDSGIKDASNKDPNYGFGWGLPQWHNGDIEGSIAFMEVLPNGYTYSVIANTRPPNDGYGFNMSGAVKNIINSVSSWPSYDLF